MENRIYKIRDIELEITNLCGHNCPYCYIGSNAEFKEKYFCDFNTICEVIDKLNEYGVESIALLGGDPVLHPRIIDIIKYIKQKTSIKVSIMSNTLDFRNIPIDELAKYIDNIDFTLHGRNAQEHEKFCEGVEGVYTSVINKLKEYIRLGVNVNIAINIIPDTHDIIYDMVKSVYEQGVEFSTLLLQRIIPYGKAAKKQIYDVNKQQMKIALEQIERAEKEFGVSVSFEDPFPLCYVEEKYHKYMKGCPEGITRMPVRGDGRVSSCGAAGDGLIGNILEDSYEDIWEKNERFVGFRNGKFMTNSKCIQCEYKEKCRGGCPIRYIMTENENEEFWMKFENEYI